MSNSQPERYLLERNKSTESQVADVITAALAAAHDSVLEDLLKDGVRTSVRIGLKIGPASTLEVVHDVWTQSDGVYVDGVRIALGAGLATVIGALASAVAAPLVGTGIIAGAIVGAGVAVAYSLSGVAENFDQSIQEYFGTDDHEFTFKDNAGNIISGVEYDQGLNGVAPIEAIKQHIDWMIAKGEAPDTSFSIEHYKFDQLVSSYGLIDFVSYNDIAKSFGLSEAELSALGYRNASDELITNGDSFADSNTGGFLIHKKSEPLVIPQIDPTRTIFNSAIDGDTLESVFQTRLVKAEDVFAVYNGAGSSNPQFVSTASHGLFLGIGDEASNVIDPFSGGLFGYDAHLIGGAGGDTITGGAGNDVLIGDIQDWTHDPITGLWDDTLYGGVGADFIFGGAGIDKIYGGAGDDSLFGGQGDDLLSGGAGNNFFHGGGIGQDVSLDGVDTVDYSESVPGTLLGLDVSLTNYSTLTSDFLGLGVPFALEHNGTSEQDVFYSIEKIKLTDQADKVHLDGLKADFDLSFGLGNNVASIGGGFGAPSEDGKFIRLDFEMLDANVEQTNTITGNTALGADERVNAVISFDGKQLVGGAAFDFNKFEKRSPNFELYQPIFSDTAYGPVLNNSDWAKAARGHIKSLTDTALQLSGLSIGTGLFPATPALGAALATLYITAAYTALSRWQDLWISTYRQEIFGAYGETYRIYEQIDENGVLSRGNQVFSVQENVVYHVEITLDSDDTKETQKIVLENWQQGDFGIVIFANGLGTGIDSGTNRNGQYDSPSLFSDEQIKSALAGIGLVAPTANTSVAEPASTGSSGNSSASTSPSTTALVAGLQRNGNSSANTMVGTSKNDAFRSGKGDDDLSGGDGFDTYIFADGDGTNIVRDLSTSGNKVQFIDVDLNDVTFSDVAGLEAGQTDRLITFGNNTSIRIVGWSELDQQARDAWVFEKISSPAITPDTEEELPNLAVYPEEFVGTSDGDLLQGSDRSDIIKGLDGDDNLSGAGSDDQIFGNNGNDLISGGAGKDRLFGHDGDDVISGGLGDDFINSGKGVDVVTGGKGNDEILLGDPTGEVGNTLNFSYGDGHDKVTVTDSYGFYYGSESNDKLLFGAGLSLNGLKLTRSLENLDGIKLSFENGNDSVEISNQFFFWDRLFFYDRGGFDTIEFFDGTVLNRNDLIELYNAQNFTTGDDVFVSIGVNNENIRSTAGNDVLAGAGGDDTYNWSRGGGNDTIIDTLGVNKLVFGADVSTNDISLTWVYDPDLVDTTDDNHDLKVSISGVGAAVLTIQNFFKDDNRIDFFEFADGTVWDKSAITERLIASDTPDENQNIRIGSAPKFVETGSGDDEVYIERGSATVKTGAGDDKITHGNGNFVVNAGEGNDSIFGYQSYNAKSTIYEFDSNFGQDILVARDLDNAWYTPDYLKKKNIVKFNSYDLTDFDLDYFDENIVSPGVESSWGTFQWQNLFTSDRLSIADHGSLDTEYPDSSPIDQFEFANGEVYEDRTILKVGAVSAKSEESYAGSNSDDRISGSDKDEKFFGFDGNDRIAGLEGDDFINGGNGNDVLRGNEGNDVLLGGEGNDFLSSDDGNDLILGGLGADTISGGKGDDDLIGGKGADVFLYGLGDGKDTIINTSGRSANDIDTVKFNSSIATSDVIFNLRNNNLEITFNNSSDDKITVEDFVGDGSISVEFSDGSTLSADGILEAIQARNPDSTTLQNLAPDFAGNKEVVFGGEGDDLIAPTSRAEIFVYSKGHGVDVIGAANTPLNTSSDHDEVLIKGYDLSEATFSNSGNDLVINFADASDSLTIQNFFGSEKTAQTSRVEIVAFQFGEILNRDAIKTAILNDLVTTGDDTIVSLRTAEDGGGSRAIAGGLGNDTITGTTGSDGYLYSLGDGADVLNELDVSTSNVDTLTFAVGIKKADVAVSILPNSSSDILITLPDGGTVTLTGQLNGDGSGIETIFFEEGGLLSKHEIRNLALSSAASDGNDVIDGTVLADVITGGAGDDLLKGGDGGDTYRIGSDSDTISDTGTTGRDAIEFESSVSVDAVEFVREPNTDDLLLKFQNGNTARVTGQFAGQGVEVIRFADGSTFNREAIQSKTTLSQQTSGDDDISGTSLSEVFEMGAGNDVFDTGLGADYVKFDVNGGNDRLINSNNEQAQDNVLFDETIGEGDVVLASGGATNTDLVISSNKGTGTLTVENFFSENNGVFTAVGSVASLMFANGAVWDAKKIAEIVTSGTTPSAGAPSLNGVSTILFTEDEAAENLSEIQKLIDQNSGDTLTFSATLQNGDPLPDWLSFDGQKFTGTPGDADVGAFPIVITATDQDGLSSTVETFVVVKSVNDAPTVNGAVSQQELQIWTDFSFDLPNNLFVDIDGSGFSYAARMANGDPLPYWLSFDEYKQVFSGTPSSGSVGRYEGSRSYDVEVVATDSEGATASTIFQIVVQAEEPGTAFTGTSGNDTLVGTDGLDTFDGGAGNDVYQGGNGVDTYFFGVGSGNDVIDDVFPTVDGQSLGNKIVLTGLNPDDIELARSNEYGEDLGMNLVIRIKSSGETLTVKRQFYELGKNDERIIQEVQFADGTVWTGADIIQQITQFTAGDDLIIGDNGTNLLLGGDGNDIIYTTFDALWDNDVSSYDLKTHQDIVDGGRGNDIIHVYDDGTTIIINRDGGVDRVTEGGSSWHRIQFGETINPEDIVIYDNVWSENGSENPNQVAPPTGIDLPKNHSYIGLADGSAGLVAPTQRPVSFFYNGTYELVFANGQSFGILEFSQAFPDNNYSYNRIGTEADDYIHSPSHGSFFDGSGGDDILDFGPGNHVFFYELGDGNDVIGGRASNPYDGYNKLLFGAGIQASDIRFRFGMDDILGPEPYEDMIIDVLPTGAKITVTYMFSPINRGQAMLDEIVFDDGTIISGLDLISKFTEGSTGADKLVGSFWGDELKGLDDDDEVYTFEGDDTIHGGKGNDVLDGGEGDDSYIYSLGDGDDRINDYRSNSSDKNKLIFGIGISPEDVLLLQVTGTTHDVVVQFTHSEGSIYLKNQLLNEASGIAEFVFDDGTVWDSTQIQNSLLSDLPSDLVRGTSEDNSLNGTVANERFFAMDGDDVVMSSGGADVIDGGLGKDRVDYTNSALAVSIDLTDTLAEQGGDAQGDQLVSIEEIRGSNNDDVIIGNAAIELIEGGAGNDTLEITGVSDFNIRALAGNGGNDTYVYSTSSGSILISASAEITSGGSDLVKFTDLNLDDLVLDFIDYTSLDPAQGNVLRLVWQKGVDSGELIIGNEGLNIEQFEFSDGQVLTRAQLVATYTVNVITGTAAGENLNGTVGNDQINALDGNDYLIGGLGADVLDGGSGWDGAAYWSASTGVTANMTDATQNTGEAAGDTYVDIEALVGSAHNDTLVGDDFTNGLYGGDGDDIINGMGSDDFLTGDAGNDTFVFSLDNGHDDVRDFTVGAGSDDVLRFEWGFNSYSQVIAAARQDGADTVIDIDASNSVTLIGINLNDLHQDDFEFPNANSINVINGTAAGENLNGTVGNDQINALDGNDYLIGGLGADVLDGGSGWDGAAYWSASTGVTANMTDATQNTGEAAGDTYVDMEALVGSAHNDTLVGDDFTNGLYGGDGDDIINGMGSDDFLTGDVGNDTFVFSLNNGHDEVRDFTAGAASDDVLRFEWGFNSYSQAIAAARQDGADTVIDIDASNSVTLIGINLNDLHQDDFEFPNANTVNVINGTAAGENLNGTVGNDQINALDGNDYLIGGLGADALDGGSGWDGAAYWSASTGVTANMTDATQNTGEAAGDTYVDIEALVGSAHNDTLVGDDFTNGLYGGDGDDIINGMGSDDFLTGDAGNDTFVFSLNNGHDDVRDFTAGAGSEDVLRFEWGFNSYSQVIAAARQDGADTVIDIDASNSVTLIGINLNDLHQDDFVFV